MNRQTVKLNAVDRAAIADQLTGCVRLRRELGDDLLRCSRQQTFWRADVTP